MSQDGAMLVWTERTTIIAIYCCLLIFADCSILFVTVIIYDSSFLPKFTKLYCCSNTSQDVAMLVLSQRIAIIAIYCCLLVFSDCSIIFVTVIIYCSSYLPKFPKLYCHGNTSQHVARLVLSERTTIIVIYYCLPFFSDCSILFVTVTHRKMSHDVAMLVGSERTTIIVIYCCLLLFYDSSIIFVTVIIYCSSYLLKFAQLYCHSSDIVWCCYASVNRKDNAIQLLLLFASFFWL
jgi:hypothetical protein